MNECALILHDAILARPERSTEREKKNFLQRVTQTRSFAFCGCGRREVDETESLCHLLLSEGTFFPSRRRYCFDEFAKKCVLAPES
jgi:hypothetical protein